MKQGELVARLHVISRYCKAPLYATAFPWSKNNLLLNFWTLAANDIHAEARSDDVPKWIAHFYPLGMD
jgi:hypothetical protein